VYLGAVQCRRDFSGWAIGLAVGYSYKPLESVKPNILNTIDIENINTINWHGSKTKLGFQIKIFKKLCKYTFILF